MTGRSAEDVIKGMPHPHQARARRLYERGREEGALAAAAELQKLLAQHPDVPARTVAERWVEKMTGQEPS